MKKKVIVLGGGIAGMSAAHELVERGFDVHVYEIKSIPGGKARTIPVKGSGKDGREDLLGEHGFRFFPRFYKHVTDTMKRIPYRNQKNGVYDNLIGTTRLEIARLNEPPIFVTSEFPSSLDDLLVIIKDIFGPSLEFQKGELEFFVERIWQIITSCKERRLGEYEKIGWWDFLEAEHRSPVYQTLLAKGVTTSLVASRAKLASTKTMGDIFLQLLLDILEPGVSSDLILNGPTSDVWLEPWYQYLKNCGVHYHFNTRVKSINCDKGAIASVTFEDLESSEEYKVEGDYYIAALPVEIIAGLITPSMIEADPTLENLQRLSLSTAWMNGIQYYLKEDVEITHGHTLYVASPWALTSISQRQFWQNTDLSEYGDGTVKGIISVCISDWGFYIDPNTCQVGNTENSIGILIPKYANECTPEEVSREVWEQLRSSLNVDGKKVIPEYEDLHSWFLDEDIIQTRDIDVQRILDLALPNFLQELFKWMKMKPQEEVSVAEVAAHINQDEGVARIRLDMLVSKGFVQEIKVEGGKLRYRTRLQLPGEINVEPLLVNLVNTWHLRPEVFTRIPNFFLASDYVRTNTDLATMEGANEAARKAVNCIIDASGSSAPYCKIWDIHEPNIFAPWRWYDSIRYKKGLPWSGKLPWRF